MQLSTKLSTLLLPFLLISCGDNTTTSPIPDISSIDINESNISLYSTDVSKNYEARVTYTDGTTANGTQDMAWSSADTDLLFTGTGLIFPLQNGGDTTLKIEYASKLNDTSSVHVKKLIGLDCVNANDVNLSDVGVPQTLHFTGIFFKTTDSNETNVSLASNITWNGDENITISDKNASSVTFTIDQNVSSILLKASLFMNTTNQVDFNKTF